MQCVAVYIHVSVDRLGAFTMYPTPDVDSRAQCALLGFLFPQPLTSTIKYGEQAGAPGQGPTTQHDFILKCHRPLA